MTRLDKKQQEVIEFAFNHVPELSEYQKQEFKLEQKKASESPLRFKREIDTKKIAEINKMNSIKQKAAKTGTCIVQLVCEWRIEEFDARKRELEYAEFIKRNGKRKTKPAQTEVLKSLMPCTDENKKMFFNNYLKPMFLSRGISYQIDRRNKAVIAELFRYFIRDPECRLDLNKGLFVCGPVGTGKTSIMQAFSRFTNDYNFVNSFSMIYMEDLNIEIDEHGLASLKCFKFGDYCFDDIAIRETKINSFGTDIMPSDEIMQMRDRRFAKINSRPTHYTSNVNFNLFKNEKDDIEKLESTYNKRSIDRIKGMCNFVYLDGPSRRID